MEYYILTFDGTAFRHDGAALTFAQIREKCLDTKNFVYAQYENRLYIPAYVSGSNIFFDSAFIQSDVCKMNRISISSSNTVTRVDKVLATNEVYTQIAAVQETVATMRSEVDVLKQDLDDLREVGVNLFDMHHANVIDAYPNTSTLKLVGNAGAKTVYIECKPNTTYTISRGVISARFSVGYSSAVPAPNTSISYANSKGNDKSITVRTDDNAAYLFAFIYLSSADTQYSYDDIVSTLQIEYGSNATEYKPFGYTAKDDAARARIGTIEENPVLSNNLTNAQVQTSKRRASVGAKTYADLSAMQHSGSATFNGTGWDLTDGGSISGMIEAAANIPYLVHIGVQFRSIVNGDINVLPSTITLGDDVVSIFSANDANWYVVLTSSYGGNIPVSVEFMQGWSGIVTEVSIAKINDYGISPLSVVGSKIFINTSSMSFGGQEKLLFDTDIGKTILHLVLMRSATLTQDYGTRR